MLKIYHPYKYDDLIDSELEAYGKCLCHLRELTDLDIKFKDYKKIDDKSLTLFASALPYKLQNLALDFSGSLMGSR